MHVLSFSPSSKLSTCVLCNTGILFSCAVAGVISCCLVIFCPWLAAASSFQQQSNDRQFTAGQLFITWGNQFSTFAHIFMF